MVELFKNAAKKNNSISGKEKKWEPENFVPILKQHMPNCTAGYNILSIHFMCEQQREEEFANQTGE